MILLRIYLNFEVSHIYIWNPHEKKKIFKNKTTQNGHSDKKLHLILGFWRIFGLFLRKTAKNGQKWANLRKLAITWAG